MNIMIYCSHVKHYILLYIKETPIEIRETQLESCTSALLKKYLGEVYHFFGRSTRILKEILKWKTLWK